MIANVDPDGNGLISFNEFIWLMEKNPHEDGDIREEIREEFRAFDTEGYGYIPSAELADILTGRGDKLRSGFVYLY